MIVTKVDKMFKNHSWFIFFNGYLKDETHLFEFIVWHFVTLREF